VFRAWPVEKRKRYLLGKPRFFGCRLRLPDGALEVRGGVEISAALERKITGSLVISTKRDTAPTVLSPGASTSDTQRSCITTRIANCLAFRRFSDTARRAKASRTCKFSPTLNAATGGGRSVRNGTNVLNVPVSIYFRAGINGRHLSLGSRKGCTLRRERCGGAPTMTSVVRIFLVSQTHCEVKLNLTTLIVPDKARVISAPTPPLDRNPLAW